MNECLNDLALITHMRHHRRHIVIWRPDDGRSEHEGQVATLHFVNITVTGDFGQVEDKETESVVVGTRQFTEQVSQFVKPVKKENLIDNQKKKT